MADIRVAGVEKDYGALTVLHDCNLEIRDNEFIVLVGPSGSGKTTLLRLIAGLEPISRGDMYFGETRVNDLDVSDRDIAMVFQNYGLYPHMSVFENMAFSLRRRGLDRQQIDAKVRNAAELLNLSDYLQRRPKQLSGGQRQRVALGRAMVRDPEVFLLDEPLSNLDAQLRVQMRHEILRVHQRVKATAVYVTHDQVEAMTMGDRIVVMHQGRIQQVGTPEELYDQPCNRFVASFIGTPAMGFVAARRAGEGGLGTATGEVAISAAQAQRIGARGNLTIGIRPEHITLGEVAGQAQLSATVEMVEMLGAEQYVHCRLGPDEMLTARMPRTAGLRPDQKVTLSIDMDAVHLFDAETEAAL